MQVLANSILSTRRITRSWLALRLPQPRTKFRLSTKKQKPEKLTLQDPMEEPLVVADFQTGELATLEQLQWKSLRARQTSATMGSKRLVPTTPSTRERTQLVEAITATEAKLKTLDMLRSKCRSSRSPRLCATVLTL